MSDNSARIDSPPANKWLIAFSVMFGAFMAVMDVSVVNVSLPYMMGSFGQTLSSITWVATSYSIASVTMVTMSGWWVTLLGRKRFYLLSFVIFTVGSILAGTAHSFPEMIIYRVLQGIGGGALIPISQAILRETFPQNEQGMAMAIFSMGVVLAPAIGPVLGGWLTDHYGWPWIFYINIPFSIAGMTLVSLFVHDPHYLRRGVRRIDGIGIVLLIALMTGLQTILERGQQENWFESPAILWGTVATVIAAVVFIVRELSIEEPVVNLRLLKNANLRIGVMVILAFAVALYGTTFVLPQFTQRLLNYPSFQAGLILMPRALTLFLFLPLVGRLYNYVDTRLLITVGIIVVSCSYYLLAHLSLQADQWTIVPMLVLMGAGMPFIFVSLSTVALSRISRENMTAAAGLFSLFQQMGGNIGYALMATLLARRSQIHYSYIAEHISALNSRFADFAAAAHRMVQRQGMGDYPGQSAVLQLSSLLTQRQAEMMAYNDISIFLMLMFFVCFFIILFLPARRTHTQSDTAAIEL